MPLNAGDEAAIIPAHDLSFATSFIVAVLFIMVKASRPMTYQYLTIKIIQNLRDGGIVDQTQFKTNYKYGFDSLIFSTECTAIINCHINCIKERLNPTCDNLLQRCSEIIGITTKIDIVPLFHKRYKTLFREHMVKLKIISLYIYKDLRLEDLRSSESRDHYHEDGNLVPSPRCGFGFEAAFQL